MPEWALGCAPDLRPANRLPRRYPFTVQSQVYETTQAPASENQRNRDETSLDDYGVCHGATSGCAAPLPTTAFDGTYAGVSAVSTRSEPGSGNRYCHQPAVPSPLTIRDGVVQPTGGEGWRGRLALKAGW